MFTLVFVDELLTFAQREPAVAPLSALLPVCRVTGPRLFASMVTTSSGGLGVRFRSVGGERP